MQVMIADLAHQATLAAMMTEAALQKNIIAACERNGLIVVHYPVSTRAPFRGWPDLQIIGSRGVLYRELKSMTGQLSVDQRRIGSQLTRWGHDWAVWRPVDWYSGTISRQAEGIL